MVWSRTVLDAIRLFCYFCSSADILSFHILRIITSCITSKTSHHRPDLRHIQIETTWCVSTSNNTLSSISIGKAFEQTYCLFCHGLCLNLRSLSKIKMHNAQAGQNTVHASNANRRGYAKSNVHVFSLMQYGATLPLVLLSTWQNSMLCFVGQRGEIKLKYWLEFPSFAL